MAVSGKEGGKECNARGPWPPADTPSRGRTARRFAFIDGRPDRRAQVQLGHAKDTGQRKLMAVSKTGWTLRAARQCPKETRRDVWSTPRPRGQVL
eukprot:6191732-Pleurochrysis_carterae.AAC.1